MENHFFDIVMEQLAGLISEQGFAKREDGAYANEAKCFKVEYNEEAGLYNLYLADAADEPEYATVSSWSFNDEKGEKEAKTIGLDFLDTLRTKLGIKQNYAKTAANVPLPKKSGAKVGDINALAQHMLAVFPKYKEAYKEHVATYGEFLYLNFFNETVVLDIRAALDEQSKKPLKKIFDALCDAYVEADRTAQNVIAVTIITGAIAGDKTRYETALSYIGDCTYLKTAIMQLNKEYNAKNKKLKAMIG